MELFIKLFAEHVIFLRFSRNSRHQVSRHAKYGDGGENIRKWEDELDFDDFSYNVINEAF